MPEPEETRPSTTDSIDSLVGTLIRLYHDTVKYVTVGVRRRFDAALICRRPRKEGTLV